MSSTTLLLIRHAHAEWSPDEMRPLSEAGRQDAVRLAQLLRSESPVTIYSSPYRRARESVEPLGASLGLIIEEIAELRERSLGNRWEENWLQTIRRTWDDFSLAYPDGGETNQQAMRRAASVLEVICDRHPEQTIAVATHGNLLVLLLKVLDPDKGYEFWRSLTLPDVYKAVVSEGGISQLKRLWVPGKSS